MSQHTTKHSPMICCYRGVLDHHTTPPHGHHAAGRRGFVNRPGWEQFQDLLAGFRDLCPAAMPVVVRTSWLPRTRLGQCRRLPRRFVIQLNRDMGEPQAIETLCHEWAHALAWNYSLDQASKMPGVDQAEFERLCHDEVWGCAFSRVYRAFLEIQR
jgi:hypothetical protein